VTAPAKPDIFDSTPALQELFAELSKTTVISEGFKGVLFKLASMAAEDGFQRGFQEGKCFAEAAGASKGETNG